MTYRWRGMAGAAVSLRMERYIGVSQARRYFADVLNTGAYASERLVILRRGEELGAFVGMADLNFLRRYKQLSRFPEPRPAPLEPDPEVIDLEWREAKLSLEERLVAKRGATPGELQEFAERRRFLQKLRAWLVPPGPKATGSG